MTVMVAIKLVVDDFEFTHEWPVESVDLVMDDDHRGVFGSLVRRTFDVAAAQTDAPHALSKWADPHYRVNQFLATIGAPPITS